MEQRQARKRGAQTLVAGAALWLVVAPLLAAWLFELTFVVTPEMWERAAAEWGGDSGGWRALGGRVLSWLAAMPSAKRPLRALPLGWFLLHAWAYVCQAGMPRWLHAAIRAVGVGLQQQQEQQERRRPEEERRGGLRAAGGVGGGGDEQGGADRLRCWRSRIEVCSREKE